MSIPLDADSLMKEVRDAQKHRDKHLAILHNLVRRYAGKYYRADMLDKVDSTPDNYAFAYVAYILPQVCFTAPTVQWEPTRSVVDAPTADGMSIAMNYWITESEFEDPLQRCVRDCLFGFGVMLTTVEAYGNVGEGGSAFVLGDTQQRPMWPACARLSPKNMLFDPLAEGETSARFIGHTHERELDEVLKQTLEDKTWIPEEVLKLTDVEMDPEDDDDRAFPRGIAEREARRRVVVLHQLYLPEHAKLLTVAEIGRGKDGGAGVVVRSQEYFGPDEGPYTLFGVYEIPDELYPLSALVATFEQFLEVQSIAMKNAEDASTHKKVVVGRADAGRDAEVFKDAKNGDFIKMQNPDSVKNAEAGGASKDVMVYGEAIRARYDRTLGFSDAAQGVATGDATLGENEMAMASVDVRVSWVKKQVSKCTHKVLRKVGWYFWNLDAIRFQLVGRNPGSGQQVEGLFIGGPWQGGYVQTPAGIEWVEGQDPALEFTDMSLSLDVESMGRQDDPVRQRRATEELTIAQNLAGMGLPINWRQVIDDYGSCYNRRELSKRWLLDIDGSMGLGPPPNVLGMMSPVAPQAQGAMGAAPSGSRPTGGGTGGLNQSPNRGMTSPGAVRRGAMAGV